jgi:hypothetical protein
MVELVQGKRLMINEGLAIRQDQRQPIILKVLTRKKVLELERGVDLQSKGQTSKLYAAQPNTYLGSFLSVTVFGEQGKTATSSCISLVSYSTNYFY